MWKPPQTTKVYDIKGRLLTEFYVQRRKYVPIDKIPDYVKNAFIAVEDKSFYQNPGIDIEGLVRAFITNLKAGRIVEGGSTISQQLVKNLFLTPERSISRKLREIILAIRLNQVYPKDKILELYLNQIYLGHGSYGVEAASLTYFGKHVWDLDVCEAAVLAGLPKAPSKYDPFKNLELATARRDIVLQRMLKEGFISKDQYETCKLQGINLNPKKEDSIKDYSTLAIRNWFVKRYGYDALYKGGYTIYTTIDKDLQKNANAIVKDKLETLQKRFGYRKLTKQEISSLLKEYKKERPITQPIIGRIYIGLVSGYTKNGIKVFIKGYEGFANTKYKRSFKKGQPVYVRYQGNHKFSIVPYLEAALISIDPKTGGIRALVGGYDIQKSKFNRALYAKRQVGSAFKPIVYLKALTEGYTQISKLKDEPILFVNPYNGEEWIPENYDKEYLGEVSLRYALIHSLNAASVWLFDKIGEKPVIKLAYELGIRTPLPEVKSLVLGTADLSPLEIATVYATFANHGKKCEPYLISKIVNDKGKVVYQYKPECKQVVDPRYVAVLTDILKGVIQEGTGRKAKSLGLPIAGKTGTTDDYTDAWFAGYSPYIATAVWVGYDFKKKIGYKVTGAKAALPIWMDFMAVYHARLNDIKDFSLPQGVKYFNVNEEFGTLADDTCEGKKLLFVEGTEPLYTCSGKLKVPIEEIVAYVEKQNIPPLNKHVHINLENTKNIKDNNGTTPLEQLMEDLQGE